MVYHFTSGSLVHCSLERMRHQVKDMTQVYYYQKLPTELISLYYALTFSLVF